MKDKKKEQNCMVRPGDEKSAQRPLGRPFVNGKA